MTPDCRWTRPRIIAHLDGEVDEPDVRQIEAHLSACPDCRAVAEAEQALAARVRSVAAAERAPAGLAERIRRGLAEIETEGTAEAAGPSPAGARSAPRRAMGWTLAAAVAAALLLVVAGSALWPVPGRNLVSAMAAEHYEHDPGRTPQLMEVTSGDSAALESYLAGQLGISVKLPAAAFPEKHGATCCRNLKDAPNMGLVACFCERRSHSVTLFVVKSEGLSLRGLEQVESGGREFWRGSAGNCRAVLWKSGPVCYALVGDFKDPADHLDLASRTATAVEVCPVK
jgi:anti-sigma factor (TIGR02949 family)